MKKLFLALLIAFSISAYAATIPVDGGWQSFSFGATGSVNSFDYTAATPVDIRIVDCCVIGDEFSVSLNGGAGVPTSDSQPWTGISTSGAFDGDDAWADPRLSHLTLAGPGGYNTIDTTVTINAAGFPDGGAAFIRVDSAVPEPGVFGLLGIGLSALALLRRRLA